MDRWLDGTILALMCGIAGFLEHGSREQRREILGRMTDRLRHRGPDEEGLYLDDAVGLGVRRLRVVDLLTGQQPMATSDGAVRVVQNGEIYNFRALRERLERLGHRFRTESDTEVIACAYAEYGDKCVEHLDGMFAFAVWDAAQQVLLVARDRLGEKPLYYHAGPDRFVFGSELRALLEHPAVPRDLDLRSLSRYLAFEYVPAPDSILAGIAKLSPGHLLTVCPGGKPRVVRYWDLSFAPDHSPSEAEWADRLRREFEHSVRRQLVSDVPLGLFLSGGIDSSSVVATASRLTGKRLRTFSVGFAEPSYDERPFARAVAAHCGTEHEELLFSPRDALELIEDVGGLLDEPLVDGSFLPIYALSRLARRTVTVVLSGDGGDELFCGYPTFLADRGVALIRRLPAWSRRLMTWGVNRVSPSARYGSAEFLLKQFFRGLPHAPEVRTQLLLGGLTGPEQAPFLSAPVREACLGFDPYEELTRAVGEVPGLGPMERLIYQHCKFYLADQNLATVDRASMACGLEVRSPFLDRPLVDLASRIPAHLKLRGWQTKYILKRALRADLPRAIIHRRKQGFGVPLGVWLRGPLRHALEERLAPERVARLGLFDPAAVERLVAEHVHGRRDHRKILWALMMFDAWHDHYRPGVAW
ncbi:MAG TPA: asparagine synthase (glutamine-hydrolyzing) [Methylomirabilota bacterium]|jgi:asparagine synthase (glutamine-hydrolysing)|nr:asparagine synthase (glutamine-hydrolyzing) [Methylomirabilota bacterium]